MCVDDAHDALNEFTNPLAQRALLASSTSKVLPNQVLKDRVRAFNAGASKKNLFDGLKENDPSLQRSFAIKSNPKRLITIPIIKTTTVNELDVNSQSNISKTNDFDGEALTTPIPSANNTNNIMDEDTNSLSRQALSGNIAKSVVVEQITNQGIAASFPILMNLFLKTDKPRTTSKSPSGVEEPSPTEIKTHQKENTAMAKNDDQQNRNTDVSPHKTMSKSSVSSDKEVTMRVRKEEGLLHAKSLLTSILKWSDDVVFEVVSLLLDSNDDCDNIKTVIWILKERESENSSAKLTRGYCSFLVDALENITNSDVESGFSSALVLLNSIETTSNQLGTVVKAIERYDPVFNHVLTEALRGVNTYKYKPKDIALLVYATSIIDNTIRKVHTASDAKDLHDQGRTDNLEKRKEKMNNFKRAASVSPPQEPRSPGKLMQSRRKQLMAKGTAGVVSKKMKILPNEVTVAIEEALNDEDNAEFLENQCAQNAPYTDLGSLDDIEMNPIHTLTQNEKPTVVTNTKSNEAKSSRKLVKPGTESE